MKRRVPIVPVSHDRADRREEEDAFFQDLQSRMPDRSRRVIEALRLVRKVYVSNARDDNLRTGFDRMMEQFLASRGQVRDEADIFLLVGESGAGKSAAIGRLLREHPSLRTRNTSYGPVTPYVSIKLKGYTIPRLVAGQIVRASGYGRVGGDRQGEIWDGLNEALRSQLVFVVHIDEAQHLLRENATKKERDALANAIKGASIDPEWPIVFILSGLPEVIEVPRADEQIERRGNLMIFTDVAMPEERDIVEKIMREMAEPAGIEVEDPVTGDLPDRLAHAARYRYARICQLVRSAIQEALHRDHTALTAKHFAKAYARRTSAYGRDDKNPFLADDWENLLPGSFLDLPEDREEQES